jgi:hypothetical protein
VFGLLRQRCASLRDSPSLAEFVKQITTIGVANGRDENWVEDQIEDLQPILSRVRRRWIMAVCGTPFEGLGQLPGWLRDKDREAIPEDELYRSLSHRESEEEFALIEIEIATYFEATKNAALGQASIQLSQVTRDRPRRTRPRQSLIAGMIAMVRRDNPDWSIEQICRCLDTKKCPLRAKDGLAGFSSWHVLWSDPKHRNRIKRFISDIQAAAPEKRI